jgi:hypothetical protein
MVKIIEREGYDRNRLVGAMNARLLSLEFLHWTCMFGEDVFIDSLAGLKNLKSLHINPEILAGNRLQAMSRLWHPASALLPNLEEVYLQFRAFPIFNVNKFIEDLL